MTMLEDLNQNVTYCSAGTLEQLAETEIRCLPFDAYADTLVAWMARMERQHRTTREANR